MAYNWQHKKWPTFRYDVESVQEKLFQFSEKTGLITGILKSLPENVRMDTIVDTMVAEAIKTSEIEGEFLSRTDVLSSIRNDLGLIQKKPVADKKALGIGQLMVSVRETFHTRLSKTQLFAWHTMLIGKGSRIKVGAWRSHTAPMQVISGTIGKEKVHFEAPPSVRVPAEMQQFIEWFNNTMPGATKEIRPAPIRSAIAHLYFESIHPFEDGNGRIGRAIAEKALSQGIGRPVLLSLSRAIEAKKSDYYKALQTAQISLDITEWINYFVDVVLQAQKYTEDQIDFVLKKTIFFDRRKEQLSERQLKAIRRMLEEGPQGFEGGMNANKYGSITGVSKATATRDLQDLLASGAIKPARQGGGRSTSYVVNLD